MYNELSKYFFYNNCSVFLYYQTNLGRTFVCNLWRPLAVNSRTLPSSVCSDPQLCLHALVIFCPLLFIIIIILYNLLSPVPVFTCVHSHQIMCPLILTYRWCAACTYLIHAVLVHEKIFVLVLWNISVLLKYHVHWTYLLTANWNPIIF